jgi:hypothetical protein
VQLEALNRAGRGRAGSAAFGSRCVGLGLGLWGSKSVANPAEKRFRLKGGADLGWGGFEVADEVCVRAFSWGRWGRPDHNTLGAAIAKEAHTAQIGGVKGAAGFCIERQPSV